MNTNLTEIIFILDRSGSMGGLESDTIGGYNSFLDKQRQDPGETRITTVLFDDKYEILHDGILVHDLLPITEQEYFTRGSTALLDAVGHTIATVGQRLGQTPEHQRPGKVIFVITTDGYENSSREYNFHQVREMITHQKEKYSWEFIFLGADVAAEEIAESIGIHRDKAVRYNKSSEGTSEMFMCMASNVSDYKVSGELKRNWKKNLGNR